MSSKFKIKNQGIWLLPLSLLSFCNNNYYQGTAPVQERTDSAIVEKLLLAHPGLFKKITDNPDKYAVQIIYTQINRDSLNNPSFTRFNYHLNPRNYFYPASLVKLPSSALALEKINSLNIPQLTMNSCMQTDSAFECQKTARQDTSAQNKLPSVANYIRRMLLVSDNEAYSRIYEFLGQEFINKRLTELGYKDARIIHRFDIDCNVADNMCTNPVSFFNENGELIYRQPLCTNKEKCIPPLGIVKKGKAYVDFKNKMVNEPKEYTYANHLSLVDITAMLRSVMFPASVPEANRFKLKPEDYKFLRKYLSMYPRESDHPHYRQKEYEDSYKKYFIYGSYHKTIAVDSVRIFNIVGQSYGYLVDCAYVVNYEKKIEFMLSAVIYVNEDEIINDGKYEYKEIGFPFMNDLGQVIYNYEYGRKKKFLPDPEEFRMH